MSRTSFFLSSVLGGLILFGILLVAVFLTGSTFGQRCTKLYPNHSAGWERCVQLLASGKASALPDDRSAIDANEVVR